VNVLPTAVSPAAGIIPEWLVHHSVFSSCSRDDADFTSGFFDVVSPHAKRGHRVVLNSYTPCGCTVLYELIAGALLGTLPFGQESLAGYSCKSKLKEFMQHRCLATSPFGLASLRALCSIIDVKEHQTISCEHLCPDLQMSLVAAALFEFLGFNVRDQCCIRIILLLDHIRACKHKTYDLIRFVQIPGQWILVP
jgi:hypothetical protein